MTVTLKTYATGSELASALRAEGASAWVRARGKLSDVELRAHDGSTVTLSVSGAGASLTLVSLEGRASGELTALVAHADALGTRLVTGELVAAFTAAPVDACILHESHASSEAPARESRESRAVPLAAESEPSFAKAIEASASNVAFSPAPPAKGSAPSLTQAIPSRPVKPQSAAEEAVVPDAGDRVEHFAFGSCEVLKSDGDRLHLRLGKDGRIKEIALEMLKVTELPGDDAPGRRFKLERRL